ncbi:MAG TPA: AAA family ATPase [Clostridiales bacterium]|jgi:uncharacterized protein YhaN|nr:AAA family ATPase [Clostridiales bacterium]
MRLRRLHIGDYGIIRNQTLDDLHSGLVLVGGWNRAGKSTLMQLLRCLGYGIPSDGSIPPANVLYRAEADILDEVTDTLYHIWLQGHAEPVCTAAADGRKIPVHELYHVDGFTYRNLFTISLNQLARIPEGVSRGEMEKLQSALLGAGLADIANIPKLEAAFSKAAGDLGGTTGRLTNRAFKPHMERINEGIGRKRKALAQVEEYHEMQQSLSQLQEDKKALDAYLERIKARHDILETVKSHYELWEEMTALDHALENHAGEVVPDRLRPENRRLVEEKRESWRDLKKKWQEELDDLILSLGSRERALYTLPLLLQYRDELQDFSVRMSGLEEQWNNLAAFQNRLNEDRNQILVRMNRLNAAWTEGDMSRIEALPLNMLEENRLTDEVSRFKALEQELKQLDTCLDESSEKIKRINVQIDQWEQASVSGAQGLKLYTGLFVISALLGLALAILHPAAGLYLGLFGTLGSALVVLFRGLGKKDATLRMQELLIERKAIQEAQNAKEKNREDLVSEWKKAAAYLNEIRQRLEIDGAVSPDGILNYYSTLSGIQESIRRLAGEEKEAGQLSRSFKVRMNEIHGVLSALKRMSSDTEADRELYDNDTVMPNQRQWMDLQTELSKWVKLKDKAVSLQQLSSEIRDAEARMFRLMGREEGRAVDAGSAETIFLEESADNNTDEEVEAYLNLCDSREEYLELSRKRSSCHQSLERAAGTQRIRNAVTLILEKEEQGLQDGNRSMLEYILPFFSQYPSYESLEREYAELLDEIRNAEDQLEACREEIRKAKAALDRLSLTDELEKAHEMIEQGRSGLYQVSYDYAVQKAAAWLCREIRNTFMVRMKNDLLHQADSILRQLTGGSYRQMVPSDDLSDFSFVLKDGSRQEGSSVLSRGTRDQVFLAVRLGRILEIQPALPIIIDDSFVNFDAAHLKQAVSIISRLGRTHQVFLLTCHPHLVEMLMETQEEIQYWKLDKGRFSLTEGGELRDYLCRGRQ